jgi:hypothetical protein
MGKLGSLFVSEAVKDGTAHLVARYRRASDQEALRHGHIVSSFIAAKLDTNALVPDTFGLLVSGV